jgi:hypothetical protein
MKIKLVPATTTKHTKRPRTSGPLVYGPPDRSPTSRPCGHTGFVAAHATAGFSPPRNVSRLGAGSPGRRKRGVNSASPMSAPALQPRSQTSSLNTDGSFRLPPSASTCSKSVGRPGSRFQPLRETLAASAWIHDGHSRVPRSSWVDPQVLGDRVRATLASRPTNEALRHFTAPDLTDAPPTQRRAARRSSG